ncbi:MAG: class I SAM-dependent methyltransferase [Alphaproteobacteria bacterium]|nr:class I SAM-dependent methyltransferase [Alphaproteobacteria bacterium]
MTDVQAAPPAPYAGTAILEVLQEARNYNAFLMDLVLACADPGGTVADFGAGIGTFASELRRRGIDVTAIEPDQAQLARLRAEGLPAVAGLSELARPADLIYSLNVLEHIEDDLGALQAIAGALRPGGRLLLYVPAFQVLYGPLDRAVGHVRRYRRRPLAALVEQAGLRIERAAYADSIGFLAALLHRFVAGESATLDRRAVMLYDSVAFPVSRVLDRVCWPLFGKNVVVQAVKPSHGTPSRQ